MLAARASTDSGRGVKCIHCLRKECSHKGCPGCSICDVCHVDPSVMANLPQNRIPRERAQRERGKALLTTFVSFKNIWRKIFVLKRKLEAQNRDLRFSNALQEELYNEHMFCVQNLKEYRDFIKTRTELIGRLELNMHGIPFENPVRVMHNPRLPNYDYQVEFGLRIFSFTRINFEKNISGLMTFILSHLNVDHDHYCDWLTKIKKTVSSSWAFQSFSSVDARFVVESFGENGFQRVNKEGVYVMDPSRWKLLEDDEIVHMHKISDSEVEGMIKDQILLRGDLDEVSLDWSSTRKRPVFLSCDYVEVDSYYYTPESDVTSDESVKKRIQVLENIQTHDAFIEAYLREAELKLEFSSREKETYALINARKNKTLVVFAQETKKGIDFDFRRNTCVQWIEKNEHIEKAETLFCTKNPRTRVCVQNAETLTTRPSIIHDTEQILLTLNTNDHTIQDGDILGLTVTTIHDEEKIEFVKVLLTYEKNITIVRGKAVFSHFRFLMPSLRFKIQSDTSKFVQKEDFDNTRTIKLNFRKGIQRLKNTSPICCDEYKLENNLLVEHRLNVGTVWTVDRVVTETEISSRDRANDIQEKIKYTRVMEPLAYLITQLNVEMSMVGHEEEESDKCNVLTNIFQQKESQTGGVHIPLAAVIACQQRQKTLLAKTDKIFKKTSLIILRLRQVAEKNLNEDLLKFLGDANLYIILKIKNHATPKKVASATQRSFSKKPENNKVFFTQRKWAGINSDCSRRGQSITLNPNSWFEVALKEPKKSDGGSPEPLPPSDLTSESEESLDGEEEEDEDEGDYLICRYKFSTENFPVKTATAIAITLASINKLRTEDDEQYHRDAAKRASRLKTMTQVIAYVMQYNVKPKDQVDIPLRQVSKINPVNNYSA